MPARALSLAETAAELGRSADWLRDHWRRLAATQKFPAPVFEAGTLVWSAAHLYAWLDRGLTKDQKATAAAFRAALDAASAHSPIAVGEAERWRGYLDGVFARKDHT